MSRFVVLDLDETLIHAEDIDPESMTLEECRDSENYFFIRPIFKRSFKKVNKRQHLNKFLDTLYERKYKVIVWSAASETYVKDVVSVLFKNRELMYLFTGRHTIDDFKDLKVIRKFVPEFKIEGARLIDDNTDHSVGQEKSFIQILPFEFKDDELLKILEKLESSWY